jgi:hypothetical protein
MKQHQSFSLHEASCDVNRSSTTALMSPTGIQKHLGESELPKPQQPFSHKWAQ